MPSWWAGPGTSCWCRAGRAIRSATAAPSPARLLVLHAPAMDAYFAELDALWAGPEPPTREAERELMSRYGMEPA